MSAGHKIITQNIAPHLDFGLDDKIEIKVNRNAKFEAMRKLFDERDIIYLADFARLTKYPVRHRIDGLEKAMKSKLAKKRVRHRIDGLEKFRA